MKLLTTIILLFSLVATSQTKFDVLWPDPEYMSGITAIQRALADIAAVVRENSEFKRFYNGR